MPVTTRSRKRKPDQDRSSEEGGNRATESQLHQRQKKEPSVERRIVCGTSGYSYAHWNKGVYYPRGYATRQWDYYTRDFEAVELNAPFYRWQKPETWLSWHDRARQVSAGKEHPFIYAVKAHQYFSHWRQLNVDDTFVAKFQGFVEDCRKLGPHCGPILLQFPPRFQCTETTLYRLRKFGELVESMNSVPVGKGGDFPLRVALEFRHRSWFEEPRVFSLAKEHNLCICLVHLVNRNPAKWADNMQSGFSPPLADYPHDGCNWGTYVRFHGSKGQYEGSYTDAFLDEFMNHFKNAPEEMFIFFNNTDSGQPPSAIHDAKHISKQARSVAGRR